MWSSMQWATGVHICGRPLYTCSWGTTSTVHIHEDHCARIYGGLLYIHMWGTTVGLHIIGLHMVLKLRPFSHLVFYPFFSSPASLFISYFFLASLFITSYKSTRILPVAYKWGTSFWANLWPSPSGVTGAIALILY